MTAVKSSQHALLRSLALNCVAANALPILAATACTIAILVAGRVFGFPVNFRLYSVNLLIITVAVLVCSAVGASMWVLLRDRPKQPTAYLWFKLTREWSVNERLLRGLPIFIVYSVFFGAFTSYKNAIGKVIPFYFDPYARSIDRFLHGEDAWMLLAPVLGYRSTIFFDFVYILWFVVMCAVLGFASFVLADQRLRTQYLVAFVLCWMFIGVVAATLLSSVGPCFYAQFYGDNAFGYITEYLKSADANNPVIALSSQTLLLSGITNPTPGMGVGISAAPSMHVAIAALNAIFLSRFGKLAGFAGWLYCAIILVGSVHLGWHYAIDGYLAVAMTIGIWKLAATLVRVAWFQRLLPPLAAHSA
jgi:hypothetical protein